jgi:hypothetical protein
MSCAHFRHKKLHYTINGKPLERKSTGYGNFFTVFIVHTIYAHFAFNCIINSVVQLFVSKMCTRHTFTKLHSKSLQIYLGEKNIKEFAFYIRPNSYVFI